MAATRSYRTYEEWKLLWNFYIQQFIPVLTVPMRNGNPYTSLFHLPYFSSSYRTYEEWKHLKSYAIITHDKVLTVPMRNGNSFCILPLGNIIFVLTVPMRNGNVLNRRTPPRPILVLTVPMRNGNLLVVVAQERLLMVLTVPMRNGNVVGFSLTQSELSVFLPYLWGMETPYTRYILLHKYHCSYRTYEEWKQRS